MDDDEPLSKPITPRNQTFAAQDAGLKNLMELEGLWKNGAQLTKLLLGLGCVFQVLASSDGKSAPEKNQFSIEKSGDIPIDFEELMRYAVMHLAFLWIIPASSRAIRVALVSLCSGISLPILHIY